MRTFAAVFFISLACASQAAAQDKALRIQQLYDQAFQYYTTGQYEEALKLWDDILRLEPEQKTARQMIKDVTEEVRRKNASRLASVYDQIQAGRYRQALSRLETLLGEESRVSVSPRLQARLSDLAAFLPAIPGKTKAWKMTAAGINAAIGARQDAQFAHNALRYACELSPDDERVKKALDWFLTMNPGLSNSDAVTPGMSLLEYKRLVALDHLHAGKHHVSIGVLNEILALEPDDLVALKRLGSAYYSLNLHANARAAWTRAQRLSPNDAQLNKFIKKLPPARARQKTSAQNE